MSSAVEIRGLTYLQNEESTKVPSRHLLLALGTFHLLFPLKDGGIECRYQAIFDLIDELCPCSRIGVATSPSYLYTPEAGNQRELVNVNLIDAPLPLVDIEVSLDLVKDGHLQLEEVPPRRPCIGLDDMQNQPFLILARNDNVMPVLYLFLNGVAVRIDVDILGDDSQTTYMIVLFRDLPRSSRRIY